jgi:hypothetical protein
MAERGKEFPLSITIRTVDKATAGIARVNAHLDKTFGPLKKLGKEFRTLHESLGLPQMAAGFRGIGGMVRQLAGQIGMVAGAAGVAVLGFKKLVDWGDELGDTAEKVGFTVDALAQLRHAAERSGAATEELDAGLGTFNKGLGQVQAGTGKLTGFLKKVSPALLKQLKGAKSNEEAFGLMANAIEAVKDPARRAALATAAFGGAGVALAPLLGRGSAGIDELRNHYAELAGPQGDAAAQAGKIDDSFHDLSAAADRVKASLLVGLGPAFLTLTTRAKDFFLENRDKISGWIRDFGEKLPGRLKTLGEVLREIFAVLRSVVGIVGGMVDKVGGAENAVKLLVGAFVTFKALQLGIHVAGIARGVWGMVTALGAARTAQLAANAAAAAGGAGGGAAGTAGAAVAGGAGRAASGGAAAAAGGAVAQIARAVPWLAALWGVTEVSAWAKDRDQSAAIDAQTRGGGVMDDLKRFRARHDKKSGRMLEQSLRTGGFVDPETGRIAETAENRAALGATDSLDVRAQIETQRKIKELNKFLADRPPAETKAKVKVDFGNVPMGTRVTADPGNTADLVLSVGYQMLTP